MIEVRGLTKRYGGATVVDGAEFTVRPGRVTGFLGPNGAGKSTTMRLIMGLDHPTAGGVTVAGKRYRDLTAPLCEVGALLDAKALHPHRSARRHLLCLAASNGIPARRVDEVLATVGLDAVAGRNPAGFSLGMAQRLGIAAALLGDPGVLLFDEPVNGLDPEGIRWVRTLMRRLADEGRVVLVSSHLMSEMALTADHLVVIGKGRILADAPLRDLVESGSGGFVSVVTPRAAALAERLAGPGRRVEPGGPDEPDVLRVYGADAEQVGEAAAEAGVPLHGLSTVRPSLEEAFMELTGGSVEYRATLPGPSSPIVAGDDVSPGHDPGHGPGSGPGHDPGHGRGAGSASTSAPDDEAGTGTNTGTDDQHRIPQGPNRSNCPDRPGRPS